MKQEARKWFARGAFVAVVAAVTLVVGPHLAAARECPYPSAGTCPPLDNAMCEVACKAENWEGGSCTPPGCCVCWMH